MLALIRVSAGQLNSISPVGALYTVFLVVHFSNVQQERLRSATEKILRCISHTNLKERIC